MNIDIYKPSYVEEIESVFGKEYAKMFQVILEQESKYEKDGICYVSISVDELSKKLPYTRSRIHGMLKKIKLFNLVQKEGKNDSLYSITPKCREYLIQSFVNQNIL